MVNLLSDRQCQVSTVISSYDSLAFDEILVILYLLPESQETTC